MIERIIENWLDKASEKAFQVPFCYILIQQGHTIIHMTRHCGMEHGKDIITKNKDGEICAYQLKGAPGSKIKLRDWQQGIQGQLTQMALTPVTHPSIPVGMTHRSFFVTNGGIEEEVSHAILAMNQQWASLQLPYQVKTIVDGELKEMAKKLTYAFLPADLKDFKSLLEFLLEDGKGCLNKEKLAAVIASVLTDEIVSKAKFKERINSAALLTSIALSNYINEKNYFVVYEGWMIFLSGLLGYCAKHELAVKDYTNEYNIGEQLAINALEDLWDEVKDSRDFLGDNPMEDAFFHSAKRLLLVGLMSSLGIYHLMNKNQTFDQQKIQDFVTKNLVNVDIWGESAIPHAFSVYWYLRKVGAEDKAIGFLSDVMENVIAASEDAQGMIGPYYDADACLKELYDHVGKITFHPCNSFYLESAVQLLTRQNQKEILMRNWPAITHFKFLSFELEKPADFFNWKNEYGKEIWYLPKLTEEWAALQATSAECEGKNVPDHLRLHSNIYPLILNVMPHRINTSHIRWFDSVLKNVSSK
ncbi:MAG: hypothetical protein V4456_11185 [Bacteroidota bacterium]